MRQQQALALMLSGANIFLTGSPGAGKTYILNEFIKRANQSGKIVAVTASTGIAATNIGGTTIHSWSGLGIKDFLSANDEKWLINNDRLQKRYNSTDVLVIDEVSMLHGHRLNMVNQTAKIMRKNHLPFGGIQIVLVGDLFQLPPITRGNDIVDFIHLSESWKELKPEICYLNEQHRQKDNDQLLNILEAIRLNKICEDHYQLLNSRLNVKNDSNAQVTRLYSHNEDVEEINLRHLTKLSGQAKVYRMTSRGTTHKVEQLKKSVLAPEILTLKKDAEVMFIANNFTAGYVNGSRGKVVDFDAERPIIQLLNGRLITVESNSWSITEDDRQVAEVTQLPLRLAWAITIHKSQGMSLEAAEIDLGRAFTPGMGYVALSRVCSINGLFLLRLNSVALGMHQEIYQFDQWLREQSRLIADKITLVGSDIDEANNKIKTTPAVINQELYDALKAWRYKKALDLQYPPYLIAHNSTLQEIAVLLPATKSQLLRINGLGVKKEKLYGEEIMGIIRRFI